jgi:hypothetical protein
MRRIVMLAVIAVVLGAPVGFGPARLAAHEAHAIRLDELFTIGAEIESQNHPSKKKIKGTLQADPVIVASIRDVVTNSIGNFMADIDLAAGTLRFSYMLIGGDASLVWAQGVIDLNTLSGPGISKTLIGAAVNTTPDFFTLTIQSIQ